MSAALGNQAPSAPAPARWPPSLREVAIWATLLAALIATRHVVMSHLDLSDPPGPASAELLLRGYFVPAPEDLAYPRLLSWLHRTLGWHSLGMVRAGNTLAYAAGAIGAGLIAAAVSGREAGRAAVLVAGTWSLFVYASILIGLDAQAHGLSWLGVGLAFSAGGLRPAGAAALAAIGALVALAAGSIKSVSTPALPLLCLAPLAARGGWKVGLAVAAGLGAGVGLGLWALPPLSGGAGQETGSYELTLAGLPPSLSRLYRLTLHTPEGRLQLLALLALTGALWPGPRWWLRLCLAAAVVATCSATAQVLPHLLRPRYLISPSLGALVLVGCLAGVLAHQLRRLGPARWAPLAALLCLAGGDTLAFLHSWADHRVLAHHSAPTTLPDPPDVFMQAYYHTRDPFDLSDVSVLGAAELKEFGRAAPPAGVVSIPLNDSRDSHLRYGAALAGHPGLIVSPQMCCPGGPPRPDCARQVISAINQAGAQLILPRRTHARDTRISSELQPWASLLEAAAREARLPLVSSRYWRLWSGQGSGGPLPCLSAHPHPPQGGP